VVGGGWAVVGGAVPRAPGWVLRGVGGWVRVGCGWWRSSSRPWVGAPWGGWLGAGPLWLFAQLLAPLGGCPMRWVVGCGSALAGRAVPARHHLHQVVHGRLRRLRAELGRQHRRGRLCLLQLVPLAGQQRGQRDTRRCRHPPPRVRGGLRDQPVPLQPAQRPAGVLLGQPEPLREVADLRRPGRPARGRRLPESRRDLWRPATKPPSSGWPVAEAGHGGFPPRPSPGDRLPARRGRSASRGGAEFLIVGGRPTVGRRSAAGGREVRGAAGRARGGAGRWSYVSRWPWRWTIRA
jgi:hypothetical protein